jgi:hypothetical protein
VWIGAAFSPTLDEAFARRCCTWRNSVIKRLLLLLVVLLGIVGVNMIAWFAVTAPTIAIAAPIPEGSLALDWNLLMSVTAGPDKTWDIPPAIAAYEGKLVTVDGVLFTMPQLQEEQKMVGAILTPPSRYGCCGLQCTTRPQLMMLCVWSSPMAVPSSKTVVARATGILRFNRSGTAWTMSELEQAQAIFP